MLSMVGVILICSYVSWRLTISKPTQLLVIGNGGLSRWTDTFFNFEGKAFEGGVIVLKNNGIIDSAEVSFPSKGSFSIEKVGNNQTILYCSTSPQIVLLLDLKAELKQAIDWRWLQTNRDFDFQDDECIYEQQEILLNNVANTYKIIISRNYKMSLSKYSRYSPQTHPGRNTTKLDPISCSTTP